MYVRMYTYLCTHTYVYMYNAKAYVQVCVYRYMHIHVYVQHSRLSQIVVYSTLISGLEGNAVTITYND